MKWSPDIAVRWRSTMAAAKPLTRRVLRLDAAEVEAALEEIDRLNSEMEILLEGGGPLALVDEEQ